jgi:hypothetical protein
MFISQSVKLISETQPEIRVNRVRDNESQLYHRLTIAKLQDNSTFVSHIGKFQEYTEYSSGNLL